MFQVPAQEAKLCVPGLTSCWELTLSWPPGFCLGNPSKHLPGDHLGDPCSVHTQLGWTRPEGGPELSCAVTTEIVSAGGTRTHSLKSPAILSGVPSLGITQGVDAEPASAWKMATPSPASRGAPCMGSVLGCGLVCPQLYWQGLRTLRV